MGEQRQVQELMGAPGSPYTQKMLGVMRFRHIPFHLERNTRINGASESKHRKKRVEPKVSLLPTFYYTDDEGEEIAVTDSSRLIRRFEAEYEGLRLTLEPTAQTQIEHGDLI